MSQLFSKFLGGGKRSQTQWTRYTIDHQVAKALLNNTGVTYVDLTSAIVTAELTAETQTNDTVEQKGCFIYRNKNGSILLCVAGKPRLTCSDSESIVCREGALSLPPFSTVEFNGQYHTESQNLSTNEYHHLQKRNNGDSLPEQCRYLDVQDSSQYNLHGLKTSRYTQPDADCGEYEEPTEERRMRAVSTTALSGHAALHSDSHHFVNEYNNADYNAGNHYTTPSLLTLQGARTTLTKYIPVTADFSSFVRNQTHTSPQTSTTHALAAAAAALTPQPLSQALSQVAQPPLQQLSSQAAKWARNVQTIW